MIVSLYSSLKLNAFKGIPNSEVCRISKEICDKTADVTVQPGMTVSDLCTLAKNTLFPTTTYTFKDVNLIDAENKVIKKTNTLMQAKVTEGTTARIQFVISYN